MTFKLGPARAMRGTWGGSSASGVFTELQRIMRAAASQMEAITPGGLAGKTERSAVNSSETHPREDRK